MTFQQNRLCYFDHGFDKLFQFQDDAIELRKHFSIWLFMRVENSKQTLFEQHFESSQKSGRSSQFFFGCILLHEHSC